MAERFKALVLKTRGRASTTFREFESYCTRQKKGKQVENIFFTSDEHYGHFNILKFTSRPFISLQDMKEKLINNHNSIVGKNDEVFHLGDMFWKSCSLRECLDIRYALNGKHYFVYGNHDERIVC